MRQRGMGWVGAIAAMVIAGLIVYGIVYYGPDIWRGIQGGTSGGGTLEDICRYPDDYIGENVTVEGQFSPVDGGVMSPYFENAGASLFPTVFQVETTYPYRAWSIRFYGASTEGLVMLDKIRVAGKVVKLDPISSFLDNFFGSLIVIQASNVELI